MIIDNLKQELEKATIKDWLYFLLIIIVGIGIGCWSINVALDAVYNINTATDPCGFCRELNPNVKIINVGTPINLSNLTSLDLIEHPA